MVTSPYDFSVCIVTQTGCVLSAVPVSVDWVPACQSTVLEGIRAGRLPHTLSLADSATIEPIWNDGLGEPFIDGFRTLIDGNGTGLVGEDFTLLYFQSLAQRVASAFVQQGALAAGETFNYAVMAQPRTPLPTPAAAPGFEIAADDTTLPFMQSDLNEFTSRGGQCGPDSRDLMPVFIASSVIEDCAERFEKRRDREIGGVLVGRLHLDPSSPAIFTEVTAHIPARHTESSAASLTFTARTWAAVQTAIAQRGRQEIPLGWWHTHPAAMFNGNAHGGETPGHEVTHVSTLFFSACDVALMRTCFPAAYSVALVFGDSGDGTCGNALFGWCEGVLVQRGFRSLAPGAPKGSLQVTRRSSA